jgi:hypothetical protein
VGFYGGVGEAFFSAGVGEAGDGGGGVVLEGRGGRGEEPGVGC